VNWMREKIAKAFADALSQGATSVHKPEPPDVFAKAIDAVILDVAAIKQPERRVTSRRNVWWCGNVTAPNRPTAAKLIQQALTNIEKARKSAGGK
jgi:hypothetical protein